MMKHKQGKSNLLRGQKKLPSERKGSWFNKTSHHCQYRSLWSVMKIAGQGLGSALFSMPFYQASAKSGGTFKKYIFLKKIYDWQLWLHSGSNSVEWKQRPTRGWRVQCIVLSGAVQKDCCHATQIVNASTLILNTKDKLQQVVRFSSFAACATFTTTELCLLS